MKFLIVFCMLLIPVSVLAGDDIGGLEHRLDDQRALILDQEKKLKAQQERIETLTDRLEEVEKTTGGHALPPNEAERTAGHAKTPETDTVGRSIRDEIGDLNQSAIRAGEFPGAIRLPGKGDISLAIGGFIKTVAIFDSDTENMGAAFLPANLASNTNKSGNTSIDATLTRLYLEGRAPLPTGKVRGYVECDLNGSNNGSPGVKIRQAYGSWENSYGTLLAGYTWSTMMDLKILPEGLTEPTVSGAVFMRQAQIRWSQQLNSGFTVHAAIEDPDSDDVFNSSPSQNFTSRPDAVLGLDYARSGIWHARLNGIVREIEVNLPAGGEGNETGWGVSFTGSVNFTDRDKLTFGVVQGEGLGRYLLGIQSTSGSAILPTGDDLKLKENRGGFLTYKHQWTDRMRSTAIGGYARSKPLDWQSGDTFKRSMYGACNVMWSVQPYLTLGIEYTYGKRENKNDSDLDNHRLAVGVQIF